MDDSSKPPNSPESAAAELSLAIGQLMRRLRTEANPGELSWSQITTLARLDKVGWMTTADLARSEFVKPQSMGTTLAHFTHPPFLQPPPPPPNALPPPFCLA